MALPPKVLTLGQVRNAIDAMQQRGEYSPALPVEILGLSPTVPPTKTAKQLPKTEEPE